MIPLFLIVVSCDFYVELIFNFKALQLSEAPCLSAGAAGAGPWRVPRDAA